MPITFACACGKTLRVPDTSAGKRAKCPACGAVVAIPTPQPEPDPEPVFEIVEGPPAPSPIPKKPFVDDDSDDGGTYGLAEPEKPDPVTGQEARPKRLPNFRIGTDNHK
ncbi:MAG: hypothetical protein J0I06_22650 [Planctomycetes bacterium]|nr:hypothetical protein [Planctomycetota bacterium]